jgi:hypothetical protein
MLFGDGLEGGAIAGINTTYGNSRGTPAISSHAVGSDWWDAAISTIAEMPSHLKEDLTAGWDTAVSGGKAVARGVTSVAAEVVDPALNRVILIVAVLGVVIYFAGKSGALKMTVSR